MGEIQNFGDKVRDHKAGNTKFRRQGERPQSRRLPPTGKP
jgi:hypothetical protein